MELSKEHTEQLHLCMCLGLFLNRLEVLDIGDLHKPGVYWARKERNEQNTELSISEA